MKKIHTFLRILLWGAFILTAGCLLLGVLRPDLLITKTTVSPLKLMGIFLFVNVLFRLFHVSLGDTFFKYTALFIAPGLGLLSVILRVIETAYHPNFVFIHFHIDPVSVSFLSYFSALLLIPNFSTAMMKKYLKYIIFLLPLLLYPLFLLQYFAIELYSEIRQEDHLIEYLTMFAYLGASIVCAVTLLKKIRYIQTHFYKAVVVFLYIFFTLGFFVIAGEEISWAQRILGIDTPESIVVQNAQQETNLHNLNIIAPHIYPLYAVFGLYCMFAWIIRDIFAKFLPQKVIAVVRLITPSWYLMLFFLPMIIYSLSRPFTNNRWEELAELIMSLGLLLFTIDNYFHIQQFIEKKALNKKRGK